MLVRRAEVPASSLIARYLSDPASHVDAYVTTGDATLEQFVRVFFSTPTFRSERHLLGLGGKVSSDQQVDDLASGVGSAMAAWVVEDRNETELLLTVPGSPIRTWLAVGRAELWFGSAIVAEGGKVPFLAKALMPFHHVYSRTLLRAAANRV